MSFHRLCYHIIIGTKRRRPLITPEIERVLYPALTRLTLENRGRIIEIGGTETHIHLVVWIAPTISISQFVANLKGGSNRIINKAFSGGPHFQWQRSYGAFTVNQGRMHRLLQYVRNQKYHHAPPEPPDLSPQGPSSSDPFLIT